VVLALALAGVGTALSSPFTHAADAVAASSHGPGRRATPVGATAGPDQTTGTERGAYEWDTSAWWPDPSDYAGTLARVKSLGVTTLYVDITEAVTLTEGHSSELGSFESAFVQLVDEAGGDGLGVDAVGGDPRWATADSAGPVELLAAVSQTVARSPEIPLEGVQFDVEPWALKSWARHHAADARSWLRFVQRTVSAWSSDGLRGRLGFTVPYWFDGDTGGVPRVTWDGSTGYPLELALGILSPLDETVLNVMAYRNATAGPNGSIALFSGNMDAVLGAGSHTELLAGQETGDVRPAETTFYGMTCANFETAASQITDAFDGDAPFEGIAVDDVESLEALCPP